MAFIKAWPTWRGTTDHKTPCMKKLTLGERTHGGLILGSGTSTDPKTSTTADEKFMSFYFSDSATSGDSRGMYLRHYIAGAGGGGESLRAFTSIDDVAGATAHGAHISLGFETSGSLTGTGSGLRVTHHIPETARSANNVNYNVIQAEIWSDAATSDPNASQLSVFRIVNGGNATGAADVDTDAYLFYLDGWTSGSGKMYYGSTLRVYAGGAKYLVMSSAEDSLTMDGRFVCDDTTDTTSGTTGSVQTDGGVGIAKALYVGTTATVAGSLAVGSTLTTAETKITLEFDETTTGIGLANLGSVSVPMVLNANPGSTVIAHTVNINHSEGAGDCDDLIASYDKVNVIGDGDSGITVVGHASRAYVGLTGGSNNSVASQAYGSQPWAKHEGTGAITAMSALSAKLDVSADNFTASTINAGHFHIEGAATVTGQFDGVMVEVYPDVTSMDATLALMVDSGATVASAIRFSGAATVFLDLTNATEGTGSVFDKVSAASGDIKGNLVIRDTDGNLAYINVYSDQGDA